MRRGAPYTYDRPEERAERAASHWCEPAGSTVYCSAVDCPYCSVEEEPDEQESDEEVDS